METDKEITLINEIGCKIVAYFTEQEIKQFEERGWKIAESPEKEQKAVANLVAFGV